MKILIVTNIPNPYRIPLFNKLNRSLNDRGHELKVIFGTKTYKRRKFQIEPTEFHFSHSILKSKKYAIRGKEGVIITYSGIRKILKTYKPNKIIVAGFSLATIKLFLLTFILPVKYYIWSGIISSKGRKQPGYQKILRKILLSRAQGGITYGTLSQKFLMDLGMAKEKIHIAVNTVDTSFFKDKTEEIRSKMNLNKRPFKLIYVGYLTQGKRIDLILKTIAKLSEDRTDFCLQIVGDGPKRFELEQLSNALGIAERIEFTGFIQKSDIPEFLADAYTFLFASEYDIWGLVLVEAMAAGIPCVASDKAGATPDLIKEGSTGIIHDFNDVPLGVKKINSLLDQPELRNKMGQAAQNFITEEVSLEHSVNGFLNILND